MIPFQEIVFPELVKDVQDIFWDHIFTVAHSTLPSMQNNGVHSCFIKDEPKYVELIRVAEKYPFLSRDLYIFNLAPKFVTKIHLDGHPNHNVGQRHLGINIPIRGCTEKCITEIYNFPESDFYVEPKYNVRVLKPGIEDSLPPPALSYCLTDKIVMLNPQVPHRVNNLNNDEIRTSVSWTVKANWTLDDILNYVSANNTTI